MLERRKTSDFSGVRRLICSGEALSAVLRDQIASHLPQVQLENLYGPTETSIEVTRWACQGDRSLQVPIGRPIWNTRAYVLDGGLEIVSADVVGELYIAGIQLARGYLGRAALTAERFVADPYGASGDRMYRTGDLARWRCDGALDFIGRADSQIKLRGLRIEPGEIETALLRQEGVSQAAVIARNDGVIGPQLVGYVVVARGVAINAEHLRTALSMVLPAYMVPSTIMVLDGLPLTPNGKLNRAALPAPTASDMPRAGGRGGSARRVRARFRGNLRRCARNGGRHARIDFSDRRSLPPRLARRCTVPKAARRNPVGKRSVLAPDRHGIGCFRAPKGGARPRRGRAVACSAGGAQPLTPQQYALWLDLKLRSDATVYNVPIAFRVELRLTAERVRGALERLATTHEVLRARLIEQDGEPCFVIDHTLPQLAIEESAGDSAQLQAVLCRPFDLAGGLLWRAALHHDAEGATVLLLVVHHIIVDATSQEILLRDFAAAFADPKAGLPTHDYDFFDLAKYEREQLAAEQAPLERFWADALADAELTPNLPPPCVSCVPGEEERGLAARRALPRTLARAIPREPPNSVRHPSMSTSPPI